MCVGGGWHAEERQASRHPPSTILHREDTWSILARGRLGCKRQAVETLLRLALAGTEHAGLITPMAHVYNNVQTGAWGIAALFEATPRAQVRPHRAQDDNYFTPDALSSAVSIVCVE